MTDPIRHIAIVGGGTAGWLSALMLTTAINRRVQTPGIRCRVTLIESATIPTVGVGEATIPTLRQLFNFLELDEAEWMVRCNATFKLGIKFDNWSGVPGFDTYWHSFGGVTPIVNGVNLLHHLLRDQLHGRSQVFNSQQYHRENLLAMAHRSPKQKNEANYNGSVAYAYHLDAGLLGGYLKEKALERGVCHVVDDVVDVALNEQGFISYLNTRMHGDLQADFFVDCSGFKGLLINQALGESFDSYEDSLFCDRAIALSLPTDITQHPINPYTTATALNYGWAWHTPLFGRSGNGYVYSSKFISSAAAEAEFRTYLGPAAQNREVRHLKMRVGKAHRNWVKNCVSIGLSGGFIEPLESTGIYLIETGLKKFLELFPDRHCSPALARRYNRKMTEIYEEIRDFIVFHYCTTQREDTPFWQANKFHGAIPNSLQEKLELFEVMLPNFDLLDRPELFADYSYVAVLCGMNHLPKESLPVLDYAATQDVDNVLHQLAQEANQLKQDLPDHTRYLEWQQHKIRPKKSRSKQSTATYSACLTPLVAG
ncbi:MAG: tryptophan halogenase family protein [Cyanobacteria bacterium P01_A01_bin.137]